MLQKPNKTIAYYLECASSAHERAKLSDSKEVREFHERMAERWMNLAASSAWFERLDLFIVSMALKNVPPTDLCDTCHRIMRLMTSEITLGRERLSFECTVCGTEKVRDLPLCSPEASDNVGRSVTDEATDLV